MLKNNYGIYIGEKNLERLIYVVVGYQICAKIRDGDTIAFLPGFQRFVEQYYNSEFSGKSWTNIVIQNTETPADAFDEFYRLVDLYLQSVCGMSLFSDDVE